MENTTKKIVIALSIIVALVATGYGAFKLYNWAVNDATRRIKKGVSDGIGSGIGRSLNPLSWGK